MKIPHGWEHKHLRDFVGSLQAGVCVLGDNRTPCENEPAVLRVSAITSGRFLSNEAKSVSAKDLKRLTKSVQRDSVLVNRANGSANLVGSAVYVDRNYPNRFLSDKVWQITPAQNRACGRFLGLVLSSPEFRRQVLNRSSGGTGMLNISSKAYLGIRVSIPSKQEQEFIAKILTRWIESVETLQALLVAKVERKRGLMQQLLTGKKRFKEFVKNSRMVKTHFGQFPVDWRVVYMGDIANEVCGKNTSGEKLPVLSCSKHRGLVNSLEYFGKRIYSEDTRSYKVVRRGEFAYATNHIEEGSIGYQNLHDAALISPMYTVFRPCAGVDHSFLFKLVKTELYRHIFEANTNGSINRRGALRWDDFSRIKVHLPSEPEQRRIASVLGSCDREIELLQKQLEALKEQKRGLMQKLLTGEIRVRVGSGKEREARSQQIRSTSPRALSPSDAEREKLPRKIAKNTKGKR